MTTAKQWPPAKVFVIFSRSLKSAFDVAETAEHARSLYEDSEVEGRRPVLREYRLVTRKAAKKSKAKRKSGIVKPEPAAVVDGIPMFVGDKLWDMATGKMRRVTKTWPGKDPVVVKDSQKNGVKAKRRSKKARGR